MIFFPFLNIFREPNIALVFFGIKHNPKGYLWGKILDNLQDILSSQQENEYNFITNIII